MLQDNLLVLQNTVGSQLVLNIEHKSLRDACLTYVETNEHNIEIAERRTIITSEKEENFKQQHLYSENLLE